MRLRFKEPLILLLIFLALALPGAQGVSFTGVSNGESISANVHASTASAAGVAYGRGDFHFYGDGDAKYSRKYSTGTTWSETGVDIKDAWNYDGHIGGGKSNTARTTNAYVDLLAEDAEYISVYGKSGTTKNVKTGVELTVEDGSADVLVSTSANGKALTSQSSLETNEDGEDAIVGSEIYAKGYYNYNTGNGQVSAEVEDGSLEGYGLWAGSNGKYYEGIAEQRFDSTLGDYVNLAASTKSKDFGITTEMKQQLAVYDGQVNGFYGCVDDWWYDPGYSVYQEFGDAGSTSLNDWAEIYATTTYIETSKNFKTKAEQSANIRNGGMFNFESGADSEGVGQYAEHAAGDYVNFDDRFTGVYKTSTKKTDSSATINDGYVNEYWGKAGIGEDEGYTGSIHGFEKAQGKYMYLDNAYQDNLGPKGGWGRTYVDLYDPVANSDNGVLTGSIEDYEGWAAFTADSKTVRSQGYTDKLNVYTNARAYYNQKAEDSYSAGDWKNYFIAEAKSTSPWTVSVDTGRQVRGDDTIQNAINLIFNTAIAEYEYGNIFLLPPEEKIYNEHDIVNNANGEVSFTLWGAGSYLYKWDEDGNLVPAANSVIDAQSLDRIFDLYDITGLRPFTFKNIDFNNGNSADNGGAIMITAPAGGTANIENSNFNDNHAAVDGGAIGNILGTVNIENCVFGSNQAGANAGAVGNALGIVNIEDSTFNDNKAEEAGGAIGTVLGAINIKNSDFNRNWAVLQGGAIGNAQGIVTVDNSRFTENHANYAGAIASGDGYGYGPNGGSITLNGCTFTNNHADIGIGGAIANVYAGSAATAPTAIVDYCTFDGNTAAQYGGAYAAYNYVGAPGTDNTITNSDFTDNVAAGGPGAAIFVKLPATNNDFSHSGNTYGSGQDIFIMP